MQWLFVCFCLSASPVWTREFTPDPICTPSQMSGDTGVIVTFDARVPEYAIAIRRANPWPKDPVFAISFAGPQEPSISTSRHQLSEGGTVLTVTDRGFG
ncbi:MAG: excinuclease ABC subunit B, partial [Pseudomonadota bacterium]